MDFPLISIIALGIFEYFSPILTPFPPAKINTDTFFKKLFFWVVIRIIFLTILCWVLLKYRKEGRNLYAIGGNPEVARLSGINVKGTTVVVYTISGF